MRPNLLLKLILQKLKTKKKLQGQFIVVSFISYAGQIYFHEYYSEGCQIVEGKGRVEL